MDILFLILLVISCSVCIFYLIKTGFSFVKKNDTNTNIMIKRTGIALVVVVISFIGTIVTADHIDEVTDAAVSEKLEETEKKKELNESKEKEKIIAEAEAKAAVEKVVAESRAKEKTKVVAKKEAEEKVVEEEVVELSIDTSFFEFASNIEVTNAIDINQHITVKVSVNEDANPGMAVQQIMTQTFHFIQQESLSDAKTITIFVTQNDKKIVQYTVEKDKFVPNENDPMADLVLNASKIEMMSQEVKEFGEAMGSW